MAMCGRKHRGAALLEVVLAMGLLVLAMAMLGSTFRNTDFTARRAVDSARALMLAEQIITYIDTDQFRDELESRGEFEDQAEPGWGWEFKREKDPQVEGLEHITVRILSDDPETSDDEPVPVFVSNYLRAEKKNLNLQKDFGVTTEQLEQMTAAVPGGTALFDPLDFDPTSFARMDMETLTQMLPVLMEQMGGAGGMGAMMASGMGGGMGGAGGLNGISQQQLQQIQQMMQQRGGGAGGGGGGTQQNNDTSQPRGGFTPRNRDTQRNNDNRRNNTPRNAETREGMGGGA